MEFDFLEELYVFNSKSNYVPKEMYEQAQADADRRLERLRTINAVLKEKGIKKPYQDELVRKLNVIQAIVEKELADAKK